MTNMNNHENPEFYLNIDELLNQIAELSPVSSQQAYLFLLLLWGYFEVSILETRDGSKGEEQGNAITTLSIPNIIQIEKGYQIVDYGSHLASSPGKYYGSYTTGRLLTTVKAMMNLLSQRGAKQIQVNGLAAAKRFAWLECEQYKIKLSNFTPDTKAQLLKDRLLRRDVPIVLENVSTHHAQVLASRDGD